MVMECTRDLWYTEPMRPRAYSYLRFSNPQQMAGDSWRRQAAMAQEYAARHELELDTELTFEDLGVSGFRGRNVEVGRLGDFRRAVEDGLVKAGSFLLVENLDRISRDFALDAVAVLRDICRGGITVVTLADNREYTDEGLRSDPVTILMSVLTFLRANEESVTKSRRLRASWQNKRDTAANRPMTAMTPKWLELNKSTQEFTVIQERAQVVLQIFEWYANGLGQDGITKRLHAEGVAPFGRGGHWYRSYVSKILDNPAVIGTLVPNRTEYIDGKKTRVPLEPLEDYYPAVIPRALWHKVRAIREHPQPRGRHARHPIQNVLANLCRCPACGASMVRTNKGKRSHPSLVCTRAKTGAGCRYVSVRYEQVEMALVRNAEILIDEAPVGDTAREGLDRELFGWDTQIGNLKDDLDLLVDELQDPELSGSSAVRGRIRQLEQELAEAEAIYQDLMAQKLAAMSPVVTHRLQELREALQAEPLDRGAVNRLLRQIVAKVTVDYTTGGLDIHWRHGGDDTSIGYGLPARLE